MAYMNDISLQNDPRNMNQINVATQRRPEVQTEIERLQESSQQLTKLAEELTMRLANVLSPVSVDSAEKMPELPQPNTPLASNISQATKQLHAVEKTLRFILQSLEL